MNFEIDYKTWRNGSMKWGKYGTTALLNEEGLMCCLGHCAINMGVPADEIRAVAIPARVTPNSKTQEYLAIFTDTNGRGLHNNRLTYDAVKINDATEITLRERMAMLISLFKGNNHELTFINVPKELT